MRIKPQILIYVLAIIMLLTACALETKGIDTSKKLNTEVGDVQFAIVPNSADADYDQANYLLVVKTSTEFECMNYEIDTQTDINASTIDVFLGDVLSPGICLTSFGPAMAKISLNLTSGEYELLLRNQTQSDKYEIVVSEQSVLVKTITTSFSQYVPEE